MRLLRLTPKVGKHYHSHFEKQPKAEREFRAFLATALPSTSLLAPDWGGFILPPGGGLAVNDNPASKSRAVRLGFIVEGEGGAT